MAKETLYKSFPKNVAIKKWENMAEETFEKADTIVPICKYLEKKVIDKLPKKKTFVISLAKGMEKKTQLFMDELMQEVDFYDVENPRKLLVRVRRFFKRSKIDVMEANIFRGLFATIQKKLK